MQKQRVCSLHLQPPGLHVDVGAFPNLGAKRKNHRKRENAPALVDDVFDITLPLPEPPSSPSKRPQSRCHYNDVESSPSKRSRDGVIAVREPVQFEERGLLFGNTTNAAAPPKTRSAPEDDSIDLGANVAAPPRKPAKKPRVRKAAAGVAEV